MSDQANMGGRGVLNAIVRLFLTSHLSVIFLIAALISGIAAVSSTPREEEPQIVVPLADVYVQMPGASAEEIENLVARPLEKYLWQIDGVEYVYSMSRRGMAIVTVRFYVGQDRERSLVKLHNRISMHMDKVPQGVLGWVVKPVEIDDVPIITVSLYGKGKDGHTLRRLGEEMLARLEDLDDLSKTEVVGGYPRVIRVEPSLVKLAGHGLTLFNLAGALRGADASLDAGSFSENDQTIEVSAGPHITSIEHIRNLVVGVFQDRPVLLGDVAKIMDGATEPNYYTRIGFGPNDEKLKGTTFETVTLTLAKKKGTNAVTVAANIIERLKELQKTIVPDDIKILITRNYGETADEKVSELLYSLLYAIVSVVALISIAMGWREGLVVAAAVPVSFSLSLLVNWIAGFTINRVTLFALILSLGLVVDDPITNVDNIQRHIRMKKKGPLDATLEAVNEVLPPVIMSTLAIIVSFLPMFFITGMMGPYMGPMAINVPLTVTFSTVCALTFVPWLAYQLLKGKGEGEEEAEVDPTPPWIKKAYRGMVKPFLSSKTRSVGLLILVVLLLFGSGTLALFRKVPLKMLPFDNKNEFLLVLDMPEGTSLERTDAAVRRFESYLADVQEVTNFQSYVGHPSPVDFNGLVRHYYLRHSPNTAEIRVNLLPKDKREQQSHTICLRLRDELTALAKACGGDIKIVEVPPGPPVLSTIVAEVYGKPGATNADLRAAAMELQKRLSKHQGVVDIDSSAEASRKRLRFVLDRTKAALHGVNTDNVVKALALALQGNNVALLHDSRERQALQILLRLSESERSGADKLLRIEIAGKDGHNVALAELGTFVTLPEDQPIMHKNLERVVFVYAEMAGRAPGEAIIDIMSELQEKPLNHPVRIEWAGEGEWLITLRVFRDLGIAFAVAMLGIYVLIVVETNSFFMPLIIMTAIPLTAIGIMPGFWLMNLLVAKPVNGYLDSVFFTATGMIGMIALGGIVVRNSIVLIEFIHDSLSEGGSLREAILSAGAVRSRPILLTAGTTALGAWPITFDPIFSGLAWSLIFGLFASTAFTLIVIPVVYNLIYGGFEE